MPIIAPVPRTKRRLMQKTIHNTWQEPCPQTNCHVDATPGKLRYQRCQNTLLCPLSWCQ